MINKVSNSFFGYVVKADTNTSLLNTTIEYCLSYVISDREEKLY